MTDLVACLSTGKGTWLTVSHLVKSGKFDQVFLITNDFGKDKFQEEVTEMIVVNQRLPTHELKDSIQQKLQGKIKGTEVALNLTSGTGTEHMAILSALLQLGVGIRFVDFSDEVQEV